jgi:predicted PurR-regulated permease PerM
VLTVLLLWLFGTVADILLLLLLAILISLYLGAVADVIARHARVPRRVALAVAVLGSIAGLASLVLAARPPGGRADAGAPEGAAGLRGRVERGIYDAVRRVPGVAEAWRPENHKLLVVLYEQGAALFQDVVPKVISVGHAAINVVSVGVMSLYLALQPEFYREWLIALFPPVHRELVARRGRRPCRDAAVVDRRAAARDVHPRRAHRARALPARRPVLADVRRLHRGGGRHPVLRHARLDAAAGAVRPGGP